MMMETEKEWGVWGGCTQGARRLRGRKQGREGNILGKYHTSLPKAAITGESNEAANQLLTCS